MTWADIKTALWGGMKYLAVAIVSSGITLIATPFFDFQKENRAELTVNIDRMRETSRSFNEVIQAYVNVANTGTPVDKKIQDQSQTSVNALYSEARAIANQHPEIQADSEKYIESLVALHTTMGKLKGPTEGGKEFIEALSDYLYEHDQFDGKVASLKKGFFRSVVASLNS